MRRKGMIEGGCKIGEEGECGGLTKNGSHWVIYLNA